jgi:hypothetical protein
MALDSTTEFVAGDGYGFVSNPNVGISYDVANPHAVTARGDTANTGASAFQVLDGNNFQRFNVKDDGTVVVQDTLNANHLSSAQGFKAVVGGAFYWNTTYPGGSFPFVIAIINGATAATTSWTFVAPFAGSVVGLGAFDSGGTTTTVNIAILKNGSALFNSNIISGATRSGTATYAKAANAFAAGDKLTAQFNAGATGNFAVQFYMIVEMAA